MFWGKLFLSVTGDIDLLWFILMDTTTIKKNPEKMLSFLQLGWEIHICQATRKIKASELKSGGISKSL